jgi:hypothetical protein
MLVCEGRNKSLEICQHLFRQQRPSKIFLVTGQTLTDEFYISHQENEGSGCEIIVKPCLGIPETINARPVLGYNVEKVSASVGFEVVAKKGQAASTLYSVYLEEYKSSLIQFLPASFRLRVRVDGMYRYRQTLYRRN